MSSAADDNIGYAATADAYWQLGWRGVLPLPPRSKVWPPSIKCADARAKRPCQAQCSCIHYTGYQAIDPSYADIMAWIENGAEAGLCLRTPDGIVGIDVDAYGSKTGAATLVEAVKRWGPLPKTHRSSSREGDLTSGIRLYRVPPGTVLETHIAFPELGCGDIEICQPHHRYIVAWPSIHPEGGRYQWRDEVDTILALPALSEIPALPQAWLDGLKVQPRATIDDNTLRYDVRRSLTAGAPSAAVGERLRQGIKELNQPGTSRHDACNRHVMALARLGKNGETGVEHAMRILCDVLIALRQVDGSNTPDGTRAEFIRMLTNEGLARELSAPGVTDWVNALVLDNPRDVSVPSSPTHDSGPPPEEMKGPDANADGSSAITVDDSAPHSPLFDLERGFWESRESLAKVYQTAIARMASPWAVLGICAARALTQVRPNATLPPLIGGPGSLNFFVALVARSGGGKGAANAAANLLIPKHTFKQKTLGSGEGLVKLFDRPRNAEPEDDVNEALLVNVDEVDTLTALSQRSGSTTIAVLKQAFSGEALGFSYVNRANVRDIEDHGYRMTLVVSVQPRKSGGMFADEGGGLPQRFMWLPAGDKRVDMRERWPASPLTLPAAREWLYPRDIAIPDEAKLLIKANRVKNAHEELDALDGHALFCREKFAYALTVMDGRVAMSLEDWELSGIAADVSTYTRELCKDQLFEAARLDAIERGQIRGIEMESADVEKLQEQVKRGQRVLTWLLHKLDAAGPAGIAQGELIRKISGRDRRALSQLLDAGHEAFYAELVNGSVVWKRK